MRCYLLQFRRRHFVCKRHAAAHAVLEELGSCSALECPSARFGAEANADYCHYSNKASECILCVSYMPNKNMGMQELCSQAGRPQVAGMVPNSLLVPACRYCTHHCKRPLVLIN
jgi:hypothetical protein